MEYRIIEKLSPSSFVDSKNCCRKIEYKLPYDWKFNENYNAIIVQISKKSTVKKKILRPIEFEKCPSK